MYSSRGLIFLAYTVTLFAMPSDFVLQSLEEWSKKMQVSVPKST